MSYLCRLFSLCESTMRTRHLLVVFPYPRFHLHDQVEFRTASVVLQHKLLRGRLHLLHNPLQPNALQKLRKCQ